MLPTDERHPDLGIFPFGPLVSFSVFMASLLPIKVPINEYKDTIDYYS